MTITSSGPIQIVFMDSFHISKFEILIEDEWKVSYHLFHVHVMSCATLCTTISETLGINILEGLYYF